MGLMFQWERELSEMTLMNIKLSNLEATQELRGKKKNQRKQ